MPNPMPEVPPVTRYMRFARSGILEADQLELKRDAMLCRIEK